MDVTSGPRLQPGSGRGHKVCPGLHFADESAGSKIFSYSLERIAAFIEIEQEPKSTESGKPPASWPTTGDIQVENLTARYSKVRSFLFPVYGSCLTIEKSGPAVLHDLSFQIRAGERIGVVGRTGSGKVITS